MWYIWLNKDSPLFGKDKMATFERYFLAEKETHTEKKNPYYRYLEDESVVNHILTEFGLPETGSHIINGHVPVRSKNGESPVKCGGKILVIDGGFSKAYQKETEAAIEREIDIHSDSVIVRHADRRKLVGDTDTGAVLREKIADLEQLLMAYHSGLLVERYVKN